MKAIYTLKDAKDDLKVLKIKQNMIQEDIEITDNAIINLEKEIKQLQEKKN